MLFFLPRFKVSYYSEMVRDAYYILLDYPPLFPSVKP